MRFFLTFFLVLTLQFPMMAQQHTNKVRSTQATRKGKTTQQKGGKSGNKQRSKTARDTKATPSTAGIRRLQSEAADLKRKMETSRSELAGTRRDVQAKLAGLQVINGKITEQERIVQGISREVATLDTTITRQEQELQRLETDLTACKNNYTRGLLYMRRHRMRHNKLMFVLSAPSFRMMYRRLRYVGSYTNYQRVQGEILRHKEEAVRKQRNELAQTRSGKQVLLHQGKTEQQRLQTHRNEQQEVVAQLNQKQKELTATVAQQQQQINALNRRIDQLIQEEIAAAERRRKAEEERRRREEQQRIAAEQARAREQERRERETHRQEQRTTPTKKRNSSSPSGRNTARSAEPTPPRPPRLNAPDNTDRKLSSNFAANQGRLPVPITGSYVVSAHFGTYNVDGLSGVRLDNKGINLTGSSGAQARCVFDGEVTAVFSLGGLSNVIVRHGSYISVYCNLSSVSVRQGQRVSTRQTLGSVARDASGGNTLHFQLRRETEKLNPERWIGR